MNATPPNLGPLLRNLRESRGMSQGQLADAAGLSKGPIQRVEKPGPRDHGWHMSTLIRIIGGLQQVNPLTTDEFRDLCEAAGVPVAQRAGLQRTIDASNPHVQAARAAALAPLRPATDAQRLADLFDRLNAALGTQRLLGILEGVAAASGIPVGEVDADPPAAEAPTTRHPIAHIKGAVKHESASGATVFTPTDKPPHSSAKLKHHKHA